MKKAIIIGTIGVLAIVGYVGVSPIVTSKMMEKNFPTVTTNVAREANIELKDITYQPSLTGATAYTAFHAYGLPQESLIKVKHEISTMPFYTTTDGSSGLAAAYVKSTLAEDNFSAEEQERINSAFNDQPPVLLETVVDYSGNYHLTLTINPAEFQEAQKTVKFSGLNGNFTISKTGSQVTGDARFLSLQTNDGGSTVQLADVQTHINQTKNSAGLWTGNSDITIANINAQTPMGEFNVNQVNATGHVEDKTQTLEYLMTFIIKEIVSPEGFPLAVNSVDYQFKLTNIDSTAAAQLLQAMEDMQRQLQTGTPEEQQQLAQQFGTQNAESVDQILRANPGMVQTLAIETAQGPVNLDMDLNFAGYTKDQTVATLADPTQLLQYLTGNLKAKSPVALLLMSPLAPQLEAYQQQGLLKIEGDTAFINAEFKDSQLTLNDQPIPLPF